MICLDVRLSLRHKLNYVDSLKAVKETKESTFLSRFYKIYQIAPLLKLQGFMGCDVSSLREYLPTF